MPNNSDLLLSAGRPGAVVVGGDFHGLAIVRSLGRRGIPVYVVDDGWAIARSSRYTTRTIKAPTIRESAATVDFLLEIAAKFNLKGWVLFPTRDEHVVAFARYKERLSQWFRVPTPEWESIKWAWNKKNTYDLAQRLGICIPRTWCPRTVEEIDAIEADFPLCIKPAVKEDFFYATKAKAWRADNREELRSRFQEALKYVAGNEVLIQEVVPGGGTQQYSCCVFFKDGKVVASMEAKRLRQHPPDFGRAATFVETVECPQLLEPTTRFLQAMNYYGLAEIEYKLDPRDGKYKLLDVNARTWGFHGLGFVAGVDFPYLLFADQIGEPIDACRGRAGVGWIRMVTDIPTSLQEMLAGRLSLGSYLHCLRNFGIESVFSRDDFMPSIMEFMLLPYLAIKLGY